jgi:hypothetical protein
MLHIRPQFSPIVEVLQHNSVCDGYCKTLSVHGRTNCLLGFIGANTQAISADKLVCVESVLK